MIELNFIRSNFIYFENKAAAAANIIKHNDWCVEPPLSIKQTRTSKEDVSTTNNI
jgi:hypothetical protein